MAITDKFHRKMLQSLLILRQTYIRNDGNALTKYNGNGRTLACHASALLLLTGTNVFTNERLYMRSVLQGDTADAASATGNSKSHEGYKNKGPKADNEAMTLTDFTRS